MRLNIMRKLLAADGAAGGSGGTAGATGGAEGATGAAGGTAGATAAAGATASGAAGSAASSSAAGPAGATAAAAAAGGATGSTAAEPKRIRGTADGDEVPGEDELIELDSKGLKSRLNRATKKEMDALLKAYGVGTKDELAELVKTAREAKEKEEKARRDQLTNEQKLTEDLEAARGEAKTWKERYEQAQADREVNESQALVVRHAEKHLDPDAIEAAMPMLAKHLGEKYSEEELKNLDDSVIDGFFADLAKKKPKWAKEAETTTATAKKPETERKPLTTGGKGGKEIAPTKGPTPQKNFSPSAPEGQRMTADELRAAKKEQGLDW